MTTPPKNAPQPARPPRPTNQPDFSLIQELYSSGYHSIIGIDEVGRGALAGPVVVAAVEINHPVDGVTDSKQIPKDNRTKVCQQLRQQCSCIRFGLASNSEIDQQGMAAALDLAYERALAGLEADLVLTDHYHLPTNHRFIRATKGDSLFFPVAAASIVAKVYRDQLMNVYHCFFPNYGWQDNAGYGTALHRQAIATFGHSPIHRQTFKISP